VIIELLCKIIDQNSWM